ncbi:MAG: hypothetical protein AAF357_03645, partial [Verrucomicrobiota bacterium]
MKAFILVILTAATAFWCSSVQAQYGKQMAEADSYEYESAAAPLRAAPPRQYNFSRAVLSEVMRLMAEDAGVGLFGRREG